MGTKRLPRATLVIEAGSKETAIMLFNTVYQAMPSTSGEDEPMMNVLVWKEQKNWIVCIFPRNKHRPSCYTAEGYQYPDQPCISRAWGSVHHSTRKGF